MKGALHISADWSLPVDFVTSTQAIVAKKRVGKTYTAQVEAEALLEARQQIVVLDPTDAWWGLRSSSDGKSPGYPITIFGGRHADLPLEVTAGAELAEAIVSERFSAVLSLKLFTKGERLRFAADFLETLYRKNREAMHMFVDEADVFVPQKTWSPEQARCLGAADEIVRRGGIDGVGITLITQRSAVVNKDVLSQIDRLIVMRMNYPLDIKAIKSWIEEHVSVATVKEMIASLPSLPKGEAWMWSPDTEQFSRITVPKKRTFDSGRTPKAGERRAEPKVLAPVDLERLGAAIAATVERAKVNDPKALRLRVRELEKQLAAGGAAKVETKLVEKPILDPKLVDRLKSSLHTIEHRVVPLQTELEELRRELEAVKRALHIAEAWTTSPRQRLHANGHALANPPRAPSGAAGELPKGEAAVLAACLHYPDGVTRSQLTVLTGYKRSSRDAYIARLRDKQLVDTAGERVLATAAGAATLPNVGALPRGADLREHWLQRLPEGERRILEILCQVYPEPIERPSLDESTGYKRSSRDAYLARLKAKQLTVDVGRGAVKASDTLFEGGAN
jgi:hypothetical protein